MRNLLKTLMLVISICSVSAGVGAAENFGTRDEAVALVRKATAYLKANGRDKTIEELNNPKGQFVDRDLYVSITDLSGIILANAANPRIVQKDLSNVKDVDGKYFIKERLEMAKTKSSGWTEYRWLNPITKNIDAKASYFEKSGDLIFACCVYKK